MFRASHAFSNNPLGWSVNKRLLDNWVSFSFGVTILWLPLRKRVLKSGRLLCGVFSDLFWSLPCCSCCCCDLYANLDWSTSTAMLTCDHCHNQPARYKLHVTSNTCTQVYVVRSVIFESPSAIKYCWIVLFFVFYCPRQHLSTDYECDFSLFCSSTVFASTVWHVITSYMKMYLHIILKKIYWNCGLPSFFKQIHGSQAMLKKSNNRKLP